MKRITGFVTTKNGILQTVVHEPDPVTGKITPTWRSTGLKEKGNKTRAEGMLRDRIKEVEERLKAIQDGTMEISEPELESEGILWTDYLPVWLEHHKKKKKIKWNTYISYKGNIKVTVDYFKGLEKKYLLEEINDEIITQFYKYLVDKRKASGETVKRYHANIRRALQDAYIDDKNYPLVKNNQADKVDLSQFSSEPFEPTYYNGEELGEMFDFITGDDVELPIKLSAFYAMRRSEVMGLRWSYIDFDSMTIEIGHTVVVSKDEDGHKILCFKNAGKNKPSERTYPMTEQVKALLLKKRESIKKYRWLCGNCYSQKYNDYVMVDQLGYIYDPDYISRRFKLLLTKQLMKDGRVHDLRHSGAKFLLHNKAHLHIVSEWLGHSNISTTKDIYGQLDISAKVQLAQIMEDGLRLVQSK